MAQNPPPPPPDPKFVLRGEMGPVSSIEFMSNDTLYAGTQDGKVHVWDLHSNRRKSSFQAGNSVCIALKAYQNCIITQIKGEGVSSWTSSDSFKLEFKYENPYIGFCKMEMEGLNDCCWLFLPAENSEVKVLDLKSRKIVKTFGCLPVKVGEVMVVKPLRFGNTSYLLVGYESGDVYLWDVMKGCSVSKFKIDNVPMAIDFDAVKRKGILGTESESVIIFKIDDDNQFSTEKLLVLTNPGVSAVTIRPDKKIFVLGCWDGNLRVYSWKTYRMLAVLTEHEESINALSYSPMVIPLWGSILLAAASKDKKISLWSFL
ncbi:Guanine nucleotide-binding protein subunit beta-like protein 1 [Frankliniella fusca]|uniref:Guanine nucleotide-binding protein subunit beta-like protein 1 n=1 Tax=Frankliniella fusca TaxID=407009 RepID=A0AAE1HR22_9NEOP|nr:Guanine nucleotide-binding protein subunit beta-like protein 1 [Frankliniella fusca]